MTLEKLRTLVLDAAFRPIHAVRWQRGVVLGWSDRLDVLEYYDALVRTSSEVFPLPAVLRHRTFVRKGPDRIALTRKNLLARDGGRCQYCGEQMPAAMLTVDHVIPKSAGGRSTWDNVVIACGPCNRRKGDRTPEEAGMPLLAEPRMPRGIALGRYELLQEPPPAEWRDYLPA